MKEESMALVPNDVEPLKNLKEGDKVYTCEYYFDGEKGNVEAKEFLFRRYESMTNHTDVKVDEDSIPAVLYIAKAPKVEIKQDLSSSFYLSPREAVQSFRDSIAETLADLDGWLISHSE